MADKMQLAEALTGASRSLERTRQRVEEVVRLLERSENNDVHVGTCRLAIVQLAEINRKIRGIAEAL